MSNRILFFGNERLATGVTTTAPALQALLAADYDIASVIVAQNELGKSRKGRPLEVVELAEQHNIPVIMPDNLEAAHDQLAGLTAEVAVLVAYGKLVPQRIIDIFPKGIVNIHPSLLPKHRGSTPIESVILEGATISGVSLMQLAAQMDAGPVYAQQTVPLQGDESKQALANQLGQLGAGLLLQVLPGILDGSLQPTPQNDDEATYDERIERADGRLDWSKPAVELEREVRAYLGWPRSRTSLGTSEVIITGARVSDSSGVPGNISIEDKQLGVYCGEGLLLIDSLIPAGKKEMPASAFLAGYQLGS